MIKVSGETIEEAVKEFKLYRTIRPFKRVGHLYFVKKDGYFKVLCTKPKTGTYWVLT